MGSEVASRIVARNEEELRVLEARLHDEQIDLSRQHHDSDAGTVSWPTRVLGDEGRLRWGLGKWGLWRYPFLAATLVVGNVITLTVEDNAHIGAADISTLAYANGILTIESGIDVRIKIQVERLHVELLIHPQVVGQRSFFGSEPNV